MTTFVNVQQSVLIDLPKSAMNSPPLKQELLATVTYSMCHFSACRAIFYGRLALEAVHSIETACR